MISSVLTTSKIGLGIILSIGSPIAFAGLGISYFDKNNNKLGIK
jgi:hypothetical protein